MDIADACEQLSEIVAQIESLLDVPENMGTAEWMAAADRCEKLRRLCCPQRFARVAPSDPQTRGLFIRRSVSGAMQMLTNAKELPLAACT